MMKDVRLHSSSGGGTLNLGPRYTRRGSSPEKEPLEAPLVLQRYSSIPSLSGGFNRFARRDRTLVCAVYIYGFI